MTIKVFSSRHSLFGLMACASLLFGSPVASHAQKPLPRIAGEVNSSQRVVIPGSQSPRAKFAEDMGSLAPATPLHGMSLAFKRSSAQEADLQALIAAQQNPASPQYHVWLTPDQFAARFGMADADLAKAQSWLQQQGFTVDGISRSKNRITFSGTSAQAGSAFGVQLHSYRSNGKMHFAPSGDLSLPAALSSVVQAVTNLSTFRPRPHMRVMRQQPAPGPNFTSGQTGNHYLTPADIGTIYDIKAAQNAGYNGAGQSIAVVGQSAVIFSDIENFQSAAGLPKKDPTLVLVPKTGTSTIFSNDESESDLDLEYSGAIATGANIYFVYPGSNQNYSVTDAIAYAVDTDIAPIISTSYGLCETALTAQEYAAENAVLEQAAAQGQTVVAAAGDNGSTDCYGITSFTAAQQMAVTADFPASSQYVTAMGGTEFPAADVATGNTTYWTAASGSDVIGSAKSYIPEQVWNDDSSSATTAASAVSAGGGGISALTARPSWQTGVPGIPSGTSRLLPDISFNASPVNVGYLYCSSDTTTTGITGSCAKGFRDSTTNGYLTVAGGTSFTVPIFAGMVAMINQATNSPGQGVANLTLYKLAANPATYAAAFHDITSGSNACTAGPTYCTSAGAAVYAATTGYDEASGLGSLDFNNLLAAWQANANAGGAPLTASTTTVAGATVSPASGAKDLITISVASASSVSTVTPTGTLKILVDGTPLSPSLTLSNGGATYSFSSTTVGSHVLRITYSGDTVYAASTNTLLLNVGGSPANSGFTLAATNLSVASGSTGTSTVTVTPNNGYTGTIAWAVSSNPTLSTGCYTIGDASTGTTTVSGTAPVNTTLTFFTTAAQCASAHLSTTGSSAKHRFATASHATRGQAPVRPASPGTGSGIALAGLLFAGFCGRRSRKLRLFVALAVVSVATLSTFGCGSSSSSPTGNQTSGSGTYTMTITGTDTSASAQMATTTLTLIIK